MAHCGCFVPATSARIGVFDNVFTRMGARDAVMRGQSTFFVELAETAAILRRATRRSLVILDELGRGTSTHDGVAIAAATLQWLARRTRCITLFVTHYPPLTAIARRRRFRGVVANYHMGFLVHDTNDGDGDADTGDGNGGEGGDSNVGESDNSELSPASASASSATAKVTFLYSLRRGVCHRSYGLNVARLADVPPAVVARAADKAAALEQDMRQRRRQRRRDAAAAVTLIRKRKRRNDGADEGNGNAFDVDMAGAYAAVGESDGGSCADADGRLRRLRLWRSIVDVADNGDQNGGTARQQLMALQQKVADALMSDV
jgi:DNA mismatch repair protein MSH3